MHVRSRREKPEIAAFAKETSSKGMPEVVIVRVLMESQSKPEIVDESSSVDGTVERVVALVADKHWPVRAYTRRDEDEGGRRESGAQEEVSRERSSASGRSARSSPFPSPLRPARIFACCVLGFISTGLF